MNNNVRVISAATAKANPPNTFRVVNISTDNSNKGQWQTCKQITAAQYAACPPGQIPIVVENTHSAAASLPKNGLPVIFISGYSAPS